MSASTLDQIRALTRALDPKEKLHLIDDLVKQLLIEARPAPAKPFRSIRGALADLGPAPSAEDIEQARREAWANFPREGC